MEQTQRRFLTVPELSEVTGVSTRSIYRWIADARLWAVELRASLYVDVRDLEELRNEKEGSDGE